MFTKQKIGLLALALASVGFSGVVMAATDTGATNMTVEANITAACQISGSPVIAFGDVVGLNTAAAVPGSTASTFSVACTNGLTPGLSSATVRTMTGPDTSTPPLPFSLSLASSGGEALSNTSATPTPIPTFTSDGTPKVVTLHGQVAAGAGAGKVSQAYTTTVALVVTY